MCIYTYIYIYFFFFEDYPSEYFVQYANIAMHLYELHIDI